MTLTLAPADISELDRLIAELARRRLLDLDAVDAAIARRAGLPGIVALRSALHRYRPSEHQDVSTFERDFAAWLRADPDIPKPRRNVRLGPWELDFHWPGQGVVAETDGSPYHRTPGELERDRIKDAWLQRHALKVLRVTDYRFRYDRPGIRVDLLGMLGLA